MNRLELNRIAPRPILASILIIDDDEAVSNIYRQLFEKEGYRVVTANSGIEGMKILKENVEFPDLVLVDCSMPDMNGESFLIKLKEELPQIFSESKVVGFTCFDPESKFFQRIKELAFDCREKPSSIAGVLSLALDYIDISSPLRKVACGFTEVS